MTQRYGAVRQGSGSEIAVEPTSSDFGTLVAANSDKLGDGRNPFAVNRAPCSFKELQSRAVSVQALSEFDTKLEAQSTKSPLEKLALLSDAARKFGSRTQEAISALAALSGPGSEREAELTKPLLALTFAAWQKKSPAGTEALFLELHQRKFGTPAKVDCPDWLVPLASMVTPVCTGKEFPDKEDYLPFSSAVSAELINLNGRRTELKEKIADLSQKNATALARLGKGEGPHADVIKSLGEQLREVDAQVLKLFDRVNDVDPATVPTAVEALGVTVAPHPTLLNELILAARSVEKLIGYAAIVGTSEASSSVTLRSPVFRKRGKIENVQTEFDTADLKALWNNPQELKRLTETWRELRHVIAAFLPMLPNSVIQASDFEKVRDPLVKPLARLGDASDRAYTALMAHPSEAVRTSFAELLADRFLESAKSERWITFSHNLANYTLLSWAAQQAMENSSDSGADMFFRLLGGTSNTEQAMVGPLRILRQQLRASDFQAVSMFLNERFETFTKSSNPFEVVGILAASHYLASGDGAERLRHQFPAIDQLKLVPDILGRHQSGIEKWAAPLTRKCIQTLSTTMHDYLNLESGADLAECLENYRFIMEHPEVLEGVPGNVAMKGGLLLDGEAGVGKTFLVDCVCRDLGITKLSISPDEIREKGETMLSVAKKKITEAKALSNAKKFCCLFLDEGEAYLSERSNPAITPQKEEMVDYLLQETNDIRVHHPRILLIVATNFIGKIDEAMLRDGRLDYTVRLTVPDPKQREAIIRSTIHTYKIPIQLKDAEIDELVKISDGFIPLIIARTLVQEKVLGVSKRKFAGKSGELTFEIFKKLFEHEAESQKVRAKRKAEKLERYGEKPPK